MSIINFSRNEPLEEAITVTVTAKPTYALHAPKWIAVQFLQLAYSAQSLQSLLSALFYSIDLEQCHDSKHDPCCYRSD